MSENVERISISMDAALLHKLDQHVASSGHANRSEAVRDMIRARLVDEAPSDDTVAGTLTVVFDHRRRKLAEHLVDLAHDHHDLVLSTMHVHLDSDTCLEVSALRGRRGALHHYARHVLGMKGVMHGDLVITGTV